jgi:hypothetical protein
VGIIIENGLAAGAGVRMNAASERPGASFSAEVNFIT